MNPYPDFREVLDGLGPKVVRGLSKAMDKTVRDLADYRANHPDWVAGSSERGLANWIHDRLWANILTELDGQPDVTLTDREPTREITVGITYRLRVKRHSDTSKVSSYPTQTALQFYMQGPQPAFPGMEEIRLAAGYRWDRELREIGEAVLSLRDGMDKKLWEITLPPASDVDGLGGIPAQPRTPQDGAPALPAVGHPRTDEEQVMEDGTT